MIMKKFYFFVSIALMTLMLVPSTLKADDCPFTPNIYPGQAEDRTAFEVSATVPVGSFGKCSNLHSNVVDLKTTNSSVIQIHEQGGYCAVLAIGVGSADVTYTENYYSTDAGGGGGADGSVGFCSTNHTIHYTVVKGKPEAYVMDPQTGKAITEYRTPNTWFSAPVLHIAIKNVSTSTGYPEFVEAEVPSWEMNITSSNTAVATASARGVQITGELGETTISASWAGNDNWEGASISYKLKVEAPKQSVIVSFSQTAYTDTIGHEMYAPTPLIVPSTASITRWTSDDPDVASVDEKTGKVKMLKKGQTRIYAIVDEDDTYYKAQAWYNLTVVKKNPHMSFSETEVVAEFGVPFTPPVFSNPNNVPINKWNSQNTDVAEVSEDGKTVTIKGVGDALIFCESYETDEYAAQSVSYILHVTTIGIKVKGISITSLNADDVLGDGQKQVTFVKETRTLHLNNLFLDASALSYDSHNAVINDENGGTLEIIIHGHCAITHAGRALVSENGGIVLHSASKKDTLTLMGSTAAIDAAAFKIYDCGLYAIGGITAGINVKEDFSVSKRGYVWAEGNKVAVICSDFTKADGEAGIEILTPDVRYEKKKGFLSKDNNPVTQVEIGKVPVTVPDDEVTTIQFTKEDPDGHESVVFSTSVNDTFNEETGQLEISTSLTDETVAEALESLVPGSSAWVSMLPGSLVFDVPAGKGEILIECMTLPGYTLQVQLEGEAAISVTSEKLGWATVKYDVEHPVHVVIYLHAVSSAKAPARIVAAVSDITSTTGAVIKTVQINPAKAEADVYVIAGEEALTGADWNANAEANKMVVVDGTATLVKEHLTLEAKAYEFKVVKNGSSWIPDGMDNNSKVEIAKAGNYTVTFTYVIGGEAASAVAELEDVPQPEVVYAIVGDEPLTGVDWLKGEAENKVNAMSKQEDGSYKLEKKDATLNAATYKYKVVGNYSWDIQYPASGDNLLEITETGVYDVVFTYDGKEKLEAVATKKGTAETKYYVAGTMNGWNAAGNEMVDGKVVLHLEAGTYQFKITKGTWAWEANFDNIDAECSTAQPYTEGTGKNIFFTISKEQDVTIEYNAETEKICVKAEPGVVGEDVYVVAGQAALLGADWDGKAEANKMTVNDGTATLVKEHVALKAGTYTFKVVKNGDIWIPDGMGNDSELKIDADGTYTVTFTYVIGETAASAVAVSEEPEETHLYIIGSVEGTNYEWHANAGQEMTRQEGNIFTLRTHIGKTEDDAYFAFVTKLGETADDWETVNANRFGPETDATVLVDKTPAPIVAIANNSFKAAPATYVVTVDLEQMKVLLVKDATAVDNLTSGASLTVENSSLVARFEGNQTVSVYNAAGQLMTSQAGVSEVRVPVTTGMYIVMIGNEPFKAIVR